MSGVKEAIDAPEKVIYYSLGAGYKGIPSTRIPSKRGVRLGSYMGSELPDP
jgi:hypothetical protein